jgi:hypothetical protein
MLNIANIVRITTLAAGAKLANANTSALALVTHSKPISPNYGDYRIYLDALGVAKDFGTDSMAAKMANAVFSQVPNITSGGGYLVVIPLQGHVPAAPAVITLQGKNFENLPDKSAITLNVNGETKTLMLENLDKTTLRTLENSMNGFFRLAGVKVSLGGELKSASVTLSTSSIGKDASLTIVATPDNTLPDLLDAVGQTASGADNGEEQLKEAILRTIEKTYYFGAMFDEISDLPYSTSRLKETAQLMQSLDKILFVATNLKDRVTDNFQAIADGGFTHTRCLFHGGSMEDSLIFQAAYASRAMSVNYSQENSAITMNGKALSGIAADGSIDQTFYNTLAGAGTDIYGDFGVPKVISNGANGFYDDIVNTLALKLNLQVETFNVLMSAPTKIAQTEDGMNFVKANLRQVLEKFVRAGVLAPGEWNSSTTYGNPEKHVASIRQLGYWVYSTPLAQQPQTDREKRIAAGTYIAVKFAGAFHSADLVLFVEA